MDCAPDSIACQLGRIADAATGLDWNAFVSTLAATVLGALIASLIALVVARSERPQPFFRADASFGLGTWWVRPDGTADIAVAISNIGDGAAYNVELRFRGGVREARQEFRVAKLEPGGSLTGFIVVRASGAEGVDELSGAPTDSRSFDWPARTSVIVSWQHPPRRRRVRSSRLLIPPPE